MVAHFKTNSKIQNAPIRVSVHRVYTLLTIHSQRGNLKDQPIKRTTTATTTTRDDDSCSS